MSEMRTIFFCLPSSTIVLSHQLADPGGGGGLSQQKVVEILHGRWCCKSQIQGVQGSHTVQGGGGDHPPLDPPLLYTGYGWAVYIMAETRSLAPIAVDG